MQRARIKMGVNRAHVGHKALKNYPSQPELGRLEIGVPDGRSLGKVTWRNDRDLQECERALLVKASTANEMSTGPADGNYLNNSLIK